MLTCLSFTRCFQTETTKLAHVVLPAKTGYEKEGTDGQPRGPFLKRLSSPG